MNYLDNVHDANGLHTFELIKVIKYEDYRLIRETTSSNAKSKKFRYYDFTNNTFISEEFRNLGVTLIIVHPDSKPITFRMRINPRRLLGDNTFVGIFEYTKHKLDNVVERVNQMLSHIGADWEFESMAYSRIDLCANKVIENPYESEAYMRLISKSFVPAGYKKQKFLSGEYNYQEKNKKSFRISNGTRTITVYDKCFQIKSEGLIDNDNIEDIGLLRFEVALYTGEINRMTGPLSNKEKLEYFALNSKTLMLNVFSRIFTPMPYFRYKIAIDMIKDAGEKKRITSYMSKKMIDFVRAISTCKSMNVAINELNYIARKNYRKKIKYREVAKVMEGFNKIGLNPITIKNKEPWVSLPSVIQLLDGEIRGEDN